MKAMSRLTKTGGARMSIVGEAVGPEMGGDLELDLEQLAQEFPDETLVFLSNKMEIGLDNEKREKEYNAFKVKQLFYVSIRQILTFLLTIIEFIS